MTYSPYDSNSIKKYSRSRYTRNYTLNNFRNTSPYDLSSYGGLKSNKTNRQNETNSQNETNKQEARRQETNKNNHEIDASRDNSNEISNEESNKYKTPYIVGANEGFLHRSSTHDPMNLGIFDSEKYPYDLNQLTTVKLRPSKKINYIDDILKKN